MARTSVLLGILLAHPASAQSPCVGWSLDNELQPVVVAENGIAHNGATVVTFGVLDPAASLGGVGIHRVLPNGLGVELVDHFVQSGLGPGFAAYTFGCAISDDGAVLVARKRPLPLSIELIQFRDTGTVWSATSFEGTGASAGQVRRHFHADGNTAAVAGYAPNGSSGPTSIDVLTVDPATGDWFVEASLRGGPAAHGYTIGDVTVRGTQVTHSALGGVTSAFAWERTAPGTWSPIPLPPEVAIRPNDMFDFALAGDRLVSLHQDSGAARLELRERSGGAWTLVGTTPLGPTAVDRLHFDGDHLVLERAGAFDVLDRGTNGTFTRRTTLDGAFGHLGDGYLVAVVARGSESALNVLPIDELGVGGAPCFTSGRNVCTAQQGGGLRYLRAAGPTTDGVVLTDAPPDSVALLLGQRTFHAPSMPAVDSLCLPAGPPRVMTRVLRTSGAGDGLWRLDPGNLPTATGAVSYTGMLAAFQALVRGPGGTVSTNAVWVQL